MAKGVINLQANDGAVVGLYVPDGLTSGERQVALGVNLSSVTAYHLLQGNLAVSNSIVTQGFNTTLYTGNGTTKSINTGIDMTTQWGDDASETFGGMTWFKSRNVALSNLIIDTVRGDNYLLPNTTDVQVAADLIDYRSTGFNLKTGGSGSATNQSAATYASWNFQTTHRKTGVTNHGKAFTEHYNPFTGFTIIKYEGSGINGHEIPHSLGRKLGLVVRKNLSVATDWVVVGAALGNDGYMYLSQTAPLVSSSGIIPAQKDDSTVCWRDQIDNNANGNQFILYGWANSYFDEANKLIGNYEIGVYQGTGAVGNKVVTRGKPAWVMIKKLDSAAGWIVVDNTRGDNELYPNFSNIEASFDRINIVADGFIFSNGDANSNVSGGQYLYMVAYDTNSDGGGTYYSLASDTANLQVNSALIPMADGIDGSGVKSTIISKNETVTGLTYSQGKNYVYCDKNGSYGTTIHRPRYLSSDLVRTYAGESPDYYNVVSNKWYSCDAGSELVTNGTFTTNTSGWTACEIAGGGIGTISNVNSTLRLTNNGSNGTYTGAYQILTGLTIGREYVVKSSGATTAAIIISSNTLYASMQAGTSVGGSFTFIAQASSVYLIVYNNTAAPNTSVNVDNISVFPVDITPTTEITNSRNYMNHIVYADSDGGLLYVEELPKTEYKDEIKANEFKGKNACTAWVNFDGTTTPPTIRDSYNVSAVVRNAVGDYDVYFSTLMDNTKYSVNITSWRVSHFIDSGDQIYLHSLNKCKILHFEGNTPTNSPLINVQVFGGRN